MQSELILQVVVNGFLTAGVYMLVAVGLNMIYGVMRVFNYAQGELVMLGMYGAYWISTLFNVNPYLTLPAIVPLLFMVGVGIQRFMVAPLVKRRLPPESHVLTMIGLIFVLQYSAMLVWTSDYRNVVVPIATTSISIPPCQFPIGRLIVFLSSVSIAVLMFFFFKCAKMGKIIRATCQDREAAVYMGINIDRVEAFTFGLGAALAGVAAGLLLPLYYVNPFAGFPFTIISFIIVTLGGLGNFIGAIMGSLIIGMVESVVGTFISPEIASAVAFTIFVLVLILKPSGLFEE